MRRIGLIVFASFLMLFTLLPGRALAASKEELQMQRDIAQLQDQMRTLQSSFDQKVAKIQTLAQQTLETATQANTNVAVLGAGVSQTLARELADRLTPVAGLAAKVDHLASDSAETRNTIGGLTSQVNRIQQQLTDINNAIKVIQTPPAAPPGASDAAQNSCVGANGAPLVPAQTLFSNAMGDYSGAKFDLAIGEFNDFLRCYPNDPYAASIQFYIGQSHYQQKKYDQSAADFDAVLERYPDNKLTPDAHFMKGMALKSSGQSQAAAAEFQAVVRQYPTSDSAAKAKDELRALGLRPAAAGAR
jgi:tol-pal system protein YbgF